ncbi:hypothetical protein MNBD_ALPHA03-905 [hydrothermal vent metagenome]|uniref:Ice-binding protein C-terminal domain-containing protein n=1 Tax=hydrothermal vent metagenome TaxID=652676 RepID=A0A3B1B2T7_9ZZZZ
MKLLKIFLTTITFMAFSVSAYAVPMTVTLSVNGSVGYNAAGDGTSSAVDSLFGDKNWTWTGSFDFSTSMTGTAPGFTQDANWYLSGEGDYDYVVSNGQTSGSGADAGSFGPVHLGAGSVSDLFNGTITGYGDILPALAGALSGTPSLTDIITALNGILDPAFIIPGLVSTSITDNIFFVLVDSDTIAFASTLGLSYAGMLATTASGTFGGSLTLMAVPEPGALGLLALGLIGVVMVRRKRLAA